MERTVTVQVQVSEATLINLPSDSMTVNFTIYATSLTVADSPTAKLTVVLQKQTASNGEGDGASSEDDGELVKNIVLWSGFLIVVCVLGFITFKILTTIEKEDDMDDWDDMYQDSLTATYGAVAAAPTVPMSAPPSPEPVAMPEPTPPAPVSAGHHSLQEGCQMVGQWSNGSIMVSNISTDNCKLASRRVQDPQQLAPKRR